MYLEKASRITCSVIITETKARLTSLYFPRSFLKIGVMFAFCQSSGTSPNCHNLLKKIQSALTLT